MPLYVAAKPQKLIEKGKHMKKQTKNIIISSLLAAVIFVLTRLVSVPTVSAVGNVNLGDCAVLISAWLLPCRYAFLASGVGSALADLTSPYAVYTPATFIIKGLMAAVACIIFDKFKCKKNFSKSIVSGVAAELIMIVGYLLFEGILYGFGTAILNVPFNAVQGVVGLTSAVILFGILKKHIKRL